MGEICNFNGPGRYYSENKLEKPKIDVAEFPDRLRYPVTRAFQ